KGDRERCLQAGMDGYISKPILARELFEALDRFIPPAAGEKIPEAAAPTALLNRTEALEKVGGNFELLQELARQFLNSCPGHITGLQSALSRHDPTALGRSAHALKGAVGIFGAREASEAAQRVESLARAGEASAAEQACATLQEAL